MKWRSKSFFLKILLVSMLITQFSIWIAKAPVYQNDLSVSSGIQFNTQHNERIIIHRCDSSSGWTNLTVLTYTFSTDTENFTQGRASVKTIINFGAAATGAFRTNIFGSKDISDKDYVDVWLRTNDTIGNYFFALYDSENDNLYWNYPVSVSHENFALYELDLANPTFEHANFNRSDVRYFVFQCNSAGFVSIWIDFASASAWQHSYVTQSLDRYRNITLADGVLGLAKGSNAFDIECDTEDRITTQIHQWFSRYVTRLRPYSPVSSSMTFDLNVGDFGEPQAVSGASSWVYEESTTTLTFSCSNYSMVSIRFFDMGTQQVVWYLDRIPMFLGLGGMFMVMLAPISFVFFAKQDEWQSACVWGLMSAVIGIGLIVGWLWG